MVVGEATDLLEVKSREPGREAVDLESVRDRVIDEGPGKTLDVRRSAVDGVVGVLFAIRVLVDVVEDGEGRLRSVKDGPRGVVSCRFGGMVDVFAGSFFGSEVDLSSEALSLEASVDERSEVLSESGMLSYVEESMECII